MIDNRLKLMEAIARRRRITARYNGTRMTLAPHQLFERHGALFVSALNLDKTWRSEDERKLGHFKLDGLAAAELEDEEFEPLPSFQAAAPRDDDILLMAV
ncbi:MAG: WYL domain-containing protein [Sphingopyxis sp.]|uniref:WYL domain-containing protein n=1 Tax=Sphingopyxis sp. TaxID=1908224 RepID=UPI003D811CB5